MEGKAGIIRDSVNGKEKYCRVPIRRRRTPICDEEIAELKKLQGRLKGDIVTLARVGCLLSDLGFPYSAGKIFSYIDMEQEKEYMWYPSLEMPQEGSSDERNGGGRGDAREPEIPA